MKKASMIISITLILALIAGTVFAWGPGRGRMMGGGYGGGCGGYGQSGYGPGNSSSNLTQEQQQQLTALEQQYIDDTYTLRSSQIETRQQISLLMQTSNPDRAKLDALFSEVDAVQKQLRDKRIDFALQAKKIAPDASFGPGSGFGKGRGGKRYGSGQDCRQGGGRGPGSCFN